jgi:hypothetical protein
MLENDAMSRDDAVSRDDLSQDDSAPISAQDAKHLFADWQAAPAIILAVSGPTRSH